MKKTHILFAGVLAAAIITAFLWQRGRHEGPAAPAGGAPARTEIGRMAPPFALNDISGNIVASDRFLGKPTVINFFATWCPPCREEIPGFVEVFNKYRSGGFELVGVSLDVESRGNLPEFMVRNGIEYRILLGDLATTRAYGGVNSIPTTFFIDKEGRIRNVHVGYIDKDAFEREVRKIM